MTKAKQKSEKRNMKPILIAAAALAVLCIICICVLLIWLVLPAIGVDIPNPFAARPEATEPQETQAPSLLPGETPMVDPEASSEPPHDESYERALEMAGEWEGMWVNNTFSSSGAVSLIIEVDQSGTATLTIDLDGYVFGMFDPDPITYTTHFGGGQIDFDVSDDPVFGDFLASGFADGTVSFEADLIPVEGIAGMTAEGTFSPSGIHTTYTVHFLGGDLAMGEVNLTKVP